MSYDHGLIAKRRAADVEWAIIAKEIGAPSADAVRKAHSRWLEKHGQEDETLGREPEERTLSKDVPATTFRKMESIEDVVKAFDLDPNIWEATVVKVGGSSWDQSVEKGTVASSVRIDATFKRIRFHIDDLNEVWDDFIVDARAHAPRYDRPEIGNLMGDDPVLAEIAIVDPHFGMLAHGKEVGGDDQDLKTITAEYAAAVEYLVSMARVYPVEKFLYLLGNDMSHINQTGQDGKSGVTKRGTGQDFDSRFHKIFTAIRRAAVAGIDVATTVAPTDALVVPGNHDPDESYRLGEVLMAWYRHDAAVNVLYGPNHNKFYGYGKNTLMFTHGETFLRKKDNLVTIMATECPADLWVASEHGLREIHTGHNHRALAGGYYPTAELEEHRGVRVRSLSGLTATDAWHHQTGYRHHRAATLLIYRKSGGLLGFHEFTL